MTGTYMKTRFRIGRAYWIKFLDHSIGIKGKMEIEVVGWVIEDHPDHVILSHWMVQSNDKSVVDDNHEPTSLIKSCIVRKKLLSGV